MRGELGEVLRRRVRKDDALPGEARQPDVRQRGERLAAVAHPLDRPERRLEPDSVVRADGGDVELCERGRRLLRRDAAERLRVLVEGEQADDRQRGARAHRPDRRDELVELVEGLDHEEVDATAFEQLCLLGEDGVAVLGRAAEGPDRAGDEHVGAGHLACVARDLDGSLVDRRDVVLEVVLGELAAVGAERIRLDDVRAGADEAEVKREDALGCTDVRLLGTAQTCDRTRDERPHPAVADERRSRRESLEEAAHRRIPPRRSTGVVNTVRVIGQAPSGDAHRGGFDQSAITHSGQRCGGSSRGITEG